MATDREHGVVGPSRRGRGTKGLFTFICPGDQPEVLCFLLEFLLADLLGLDQVKYPCREKHGGIAVGLSVALVHISTPSSCTQPKDLGCGVQQNSLRGWGAQCRTGRNLFSKLHWRSSDLQETITGTKLGSMGSRIPLLSTRSPHATHPMGVFPTSFCLLFIDSLNHYGW